MRKTILIIYILCAAAITVHAQKKLIREGNKQYEARNYNAAAEAYQKALMNNPGDLKGLFNLGNTLYQQQQYEAARKMLNATTKTTEDKASKSAANYNVGNTYMKEKKWDEAINAYKQALRNNPQDADAKYNLSYAQKMKQQQQGEGGGKNDKNKDKDKDKQDNKDQNKDNKGDNNEEQKDKQDQQNKDKGEQDKKDEQKKEEEGKGEQQKEEEQKRPQPQPSKLSEQQAEQLLNALQQEEKKLMDKMHQGKGVPVRVQKDW